MTTQVENNDTNAVETFRADCVNAVDTRMFFEARKSAQSESVDETNYKSVLSFNNASMFSTLSDIRKSVDHARIAEIMLLSQCSAKRIVEQERSSNMRNVYAYEKEINIARAIARVVALNHYTKAVFLSALVLEKNETVLTHKDAISACSLSCKVNDAKREKLLAKSKYAKHVAANTAATQSSSSINALQSFSVLVESRDASNAVCYRVNRDAYATKELARFLDVTL
jgi:hypothetical protein